MSQNYENSEYMEKVPYDFEPAILKYPKEIKDLISVIIPIYNTELYLREALDSVIANTFENWEAILVNDGSTDGCSEICKEYAKKDNRFKYICKEKNEGLLLARKTGLENSRGEFIANLDSDDTYHPQFLEKMLAKIKEGNNDFIYCNYKYLNNEWKINYEMPDISKNKFENVRRYNMFGNVTVWNKLVRRSIYERVLFPRVNIVPGEDRIQTSQIIYHSERIGLVSEHLYLQRLNVNSSTRTSNAASIKRNYISNVIWSIAFYLLMKRFFGAFDAERISVDMNLFGYYFVFSKKELKHYKIEYAKNFIPAFLRGLKKAESKTFVKKIRNVVLILACKGFTLPVKIWGKLLPSAKKSKLISRIYRKFYVAYEIPQSNKQEDLEKVPYAFEPVILKYPKEIEGLVSIIIPIYNSELYLREALESVISQTFGNWEAILINDGSTDKSSDICIEYAKRDSRFKYICKNNEGSFLARKMGFENSRGEFITGLDSDDAYRSQFLEKMFAKMKEGNHDFVYCNFEDLGGKEKFLYGMRLGVENYEFGKDKLENNRNFLKFGGPFLWNKLIKRSIAAKVLFPRIFAVSEDQLIHLQIVYHSNNAEFVGENLYLYRVTSVNSISKTFRILSEEKHKVTSLRWAITRYLLMKRFFGASEVESFLVNGAFIELFLLSEETIARYEMEYAKNFIPAFSRGLKKSEKNLFYKLIFILAYRGFPLPLKICRRAKAIFWQLKRKLYWVIY